MTEEYLEYEVKDIEGLADWKTETILYLRVYGTVEGKTVDFDNTVICPKSLNTYDEAAKWIMDMVIIPESENVLNMTEEELQKSCRKMNVVV